MNGKILAASILSGSVAIGGISVALFKPVKPPSLDNFILSSTSIGPFNDVINKDDVIITIKNNTQTINKYKVGMLFYNGTTSMSGIYPNTQYIPPNDEAEFVFSKIYNNLSNITSIHIVIYENDELSKEYINDVPNYRIESIDINSLESEKYIFKDKSFYYLDNKKKENEYIYNFEGMVSNSFEIKNYELDFSSFNFSYSGEFKYSYASLIFDEIFFPYINNEIPIKLEINNAKISFLLNKTLYYDPQTLEMYEAYNIGLEETNRLFIKRDRLDDIDNKNISFKIIGFGNGLNSITYQTNFTYTSNPIGECHDSTVCIIGGIR